MAFCKDEKKPTVVCLTNWSYVLCNLRQFCNTSIQNPVFAFFDIHSFCQLVIKVDTAIEFRLQTVTKYTLWKWGHFDRAKSTLKMLPASWTFDILWEGV